MKGRVIAAAIVAILDFGMYSKMEGLAITERGYSAIGGEELLLAFGLFLVVYILAGGFSGKKKSGNPKATANQTESEQSKSNRFDA